MTLRWRHLVDAGYSCCSLTGPIWAPFGQQENGNLRLTPPLKGELQVCKLLVYESMKRLLYFAPYYVGQSCEIKLRQPRHCTPVVSPLRRLNQAHKFESSKLLATKQEPVSKAQGCSSPGEYVPTCTEPWVQSPAQRSPRQRCWRDGSLAQGTSCSSGGPEFTFQHPW